MTYTLLGCFGMRFEQNVHLRLGVIKETVSYFGLAPALTSLGHIGLRTGVEITRLGL